MKAIVLAAGKGTRLQSEQFNLPKVLREANGKPLIKYVLDNISFIPKDDTVIVVGYMKDKVIEVLDLSYNYASQDEQKGTGHAVMMAEDFFCDYDGNVLILYGDMPLLKRETYEGLIKIHSESKADCTLLTANVKNPPAYGRIVRDASGKLSAIVEQKDCTPEQLLITELNVGVYVFNSRLLFDGLKQLKNDNAQGEYYLTDIPLIFLNEGKKIETFTTNNIEEIFGVNTPDDLKFCEGVLKERC